MLVIASAPSATLPKAVINARRAMYSPQDTRVRSWQTSTLPANGERENAQNEQYFPQPNLLAVAVLVLQRAIFRANRSRVYAREFAVPRVCLGQRLNFQAISG